MNYRKIYYIVRLKDDFNMPGTTISHTFCAYIEHYSERQGIWFRLNGSNALIIVPINAIEYLASSKNHWTGEKEHI